MRVTIKIASCLGILVAILVAAASVKPIDADSNAADWLKLMGYRNPLTALFTAHINNWLWVGVTLLILSLFGILESRASNGSGKAAFPRKTPKPKRGVMLFGEGLEHLKVTVEPPSSSPYSTHFVPSQPRDKGDVFRRWMADEHERQSLDRKAKWEIDRQQQSSPKRDTALRQGLAFASYGDWQTDAFDQITKGEAHLFAAAIAQFRQLAADGKLSVWGKSGKSGLSGVFEPIPPEHWRVAWVDFLDALRENPSSKMANGEKGEPFLDLMISRIEFEREWPSH
jgi:hypothetical protein